MRARLLHMTAGKLLVVGCRSRGGLSARADLALKLGAPRMSVASYRQHPKVERPADNRSSSPPFSAGHRPEDGPDSSVAAISGSGRVLQRRKLILGIAALGALAPPFEAWSQRVAAKRIGMLSGGDLQGTPNWDAFYENMRSLGYVEGRDVIYDRQAAAGEPQRLPQMARELVARKPDLLVTTGASEALAARAATSTIPIVMMFGGDPVGAGLAVSLAHPGGNVTGLTRFIPGFIAKSVEMLHDALPLAKRIAVLENPLAPTYTQYHQELVRAAASLGLTLMPPASASRPEDLEVAFTKIEQQQPDALFVTSDVLFYTQRARIVQFVVRRQLPSLHSFTEDVDAGGLMAYAVEFRELYERAPIFIDKIFKGTPPAELPIELPTRIGLWVNLKTARTLGLKIPQSVLLRAVKTIE